MKAATSAAIFIALGLACTGCSLSRGVLGAPADGAIDTDVHDGHVTEPDAHVDVDAFVHDAGIDAPAFPDVGIDASEEAGLDANVDAYSTIDSGCVVDTTMCMGNEVWHCDADGAFRWRQTCPQGCTETPATHCLQVRATHVNDLALLPQGTTALHVSSGQTVQVDSSTGAITLLPSTVIRAPGASSSAGAIGFSTQLQTGPTGTPGLAIFWFSTITIDHGGTLVGVGGSAIVLLATGDVLIDGVIEMGANGTVGGPGGFAGGGHRADGNGPSHGGRGGLAGIANELQAGGGGGGHGGTGGTGGDEDAICCVTADGGGGGGVTADSNGIPLIGGSGGGGGTNDTSGGVGGGGGGAIQITSLTMIRVTSGGLVRAPGAGGGHGDQAGGGGGAGGVIFLEAISLDIDGVVTVNGGGGGGGGGGGAHDGTRGTDMASPTPGGGGDSGGGDGGGGAGGTSISGGNGSQGNGGGGGGGGGGRVVFVTMAGSYMASGVISPVGTVQTAVATIR